MLETSCVRSQVLRSQERSQCLTNQQQGFVKHRSAVRGSGVRDSLVRHNGNFMDNQRWRTFGRLEGKLERHREKETRTDGQTDRQADKQTDRPTDRQTEGENIYLINVVTRETRYTHRAKLFLRQLYKLEAPTAHAWTFARVCVQAVEFAAKLMHFVPQLDYPGDWRKAVSAISGNVARERFDEVPPTSKLVSATSDENSPLPLPFYVTMGRFYPYHPHF